MALMAFLTLNFITMETFISLPNILGTSPATQTTVQLFNAIRIIKKDVNGKYLITATRPHLNGVMTVK